MLCRNWLSLISPNLRPSAEVCHHRLNRLQGHFTPGLLYSLKDERSFKSRLADQSIWSLNKVCVHTVSSQVFGSFHSLSFSFSKIMQHKFFCEIATFTSRILSFDNFFPTYSWLLIFYDFRLNFPLEAWQILERSQNDSNPLASPLNLILNTLPGTLAPWIAIRILVKKNKL